MDGKTANHASLVAGVRPHILSTVSDYGEENPLFYDYYGMSPDLYRIKFKSRGDSALSQHVVQLLKEVHFLSLRLLIVYLIPHRQG